MKNYIKQIELLLKPKVDDEAAKKAEEKMVSFSDAFKKQFNNVLGGDNGKSFGEAFGQYFGSKLTRAINSAWDNLKNILSDAWSELGDILNYSLLSNSKTRDLAFTYGFSGSQAYGFETAKELMGIENDEDLMYMNKDQWNQFSELFSKYTDKYSELYDSGFFEEYRQFQVEMQEFKQDFQMQFMKLIMDNKDTIITGMKAIISLADTVLSILSWLMDTFGDSSTTSSERLSATNDIINSYGGNISNTSTVNASVNQTFNNVSKEDQSWLANVGSMTYEQLCQMLK